MATTAAAIHPAAEIKVRREWRYSLGGLFRTVTVVCLAMFAVVQFGPLAAARDMGIALAVALALVACGKRNARS